MTGRDSFKGRLKTATFSYVHVVRLNFTTASHTIQYVDEWVSNLTHNGSF